MSRPHLALELLRAEQTRRATSDMSRRPLLDFIPATTPERFRPEHLAPLAEALDRAIEGEPVRVLISVPPQHGKTDLIAHAVARWLRRHPRHTLGYVTYSAQQARDKSDEARRFAVAAGVQLRRDRKALDRWRTPEGGGLIAAGIGGPLTGNNCACVFIDDPYRNAEDANSAAWRRKVENYVRGVAGTRGTQRISIVIVHTRWHNEDIIGTLAKEKGWTVINLPVVADAQGRPVDDVMTGRPLLSLRETPAGDAMGFTLEGLQERRLLLGEYLWWAIYMGAPRPRGGSVFRGLPKRYTEAPKLVRSGKRVVLALDAAGSASEKANHSAIVALAVDDARPLPSAWVLDLDYWQLEPQDSAPRVAQFVKEWGGGGGLLIEDTRDGRAIGKVLVKLAPGLRVTYVPPVGDKFMRAQLGAAAWNQGRVHVPADAPWVPRLLQRFTDFRGVGDEDDDEVDAFSHAFNHALGAAAVGATFIDR